MGKGDDDRYDPEEEGSESGSESAMVSVSPRGCAPQYENASGTAALYCAQARPGMGKLFACLLRGSRGAGAKVLQLPYGGLGHSGSSASLSSTSRPERLALLDGESFCGNCAGVVGADGRCGECGMTVAMAHEESTEDDDDSAFARSDSEAAGLRAAFADRGPQGSRLSVSRQTRLRRATLAKFEGTLKHAGRRRIQTMDAGFRRRLQKARKEIRDDKATRRLQRTHTLRHDFFKDVPLKQLLEAYKREQGESDVFSELHEDVKPSRADGRGRGVSTSSRARKHMSTATSGTATSELVEVPEEDEEEYNKDIDHFLAESLAQMRKNEKALAKQEKQLHAAKVRQIKELRSNLLSEQAALIARVRSQSKAVIRGLRKHAKELMALLKKRVKEDDDVDGDTTNMIAEMNALAQAYSQTAGGGGGGDSDGDGGDGDGGDEEDGLDSVFDDVFTRERQDLERAQTLMQHRFESRIGKLQEELATTVGHLNNLELEQFFPKCMMWKVRLNSGDGLFIGMRDLDLETLDANVQAGRGAELGTVEMEVTNIRAIIGIYQFSIDGNTAKAKLLRGLLTPTVNRLDLEISGNWKFKLRFQPGEKSKDHRPKWVKEKSVFELRLTKTVSGASLVRLPDRVIRWLTTQLIPTVISNAVTLNLPIRLGMFFQHPQNYVRVKGKIRLRGDIPPRVWCAPLVAPTHSAKLARKAMGLSDEEAVFLDLMFRSDLATCAGFHRKALSMNRFFKWRLQYASMPTSRLAKILQLIESDPSVPLQHANKGKGGGDGGLVAPEGWAMQLLNRVAEIAVKPVTFDLEINEIDCDVNVKQGVDIFTGLYVESLEHELEKAVGTRAIRAAAKALQRAKEKSERIEHFLETYLAPPLSNKIAFDLRALMMGGIVSGITMATVRNLTAQIKLPSSFEVSWLAGFAYELTEGFKLTINGEQGPEQGEYTLQAKHKHVNPEESTYPFDSIPEDDAQAIIRDLQLNLFPRDLDPGSIRLTAESVRASFYMCTLGEATYPDATDMPASGSGSNSGGGSDGDGRSRAESVLSDEDLVSAVGTRATGASEDHVELLLQKSRDIVSDLWTRYNASQRDAKRMFNKDGNATGPPNGRQLSPEAARVHPVLPTMLTDERYDLQIDVRGVKVQAIREIGTDGKDTVRVTIARSDSDLDPGDTIAAFHMRFRLGELFELDEPF